MLINNDKPNLITLIEKALNAETKRNKLIVNNIANVDVPNFKRSELNFESELKRAIHENENRNGNNLPAKLTNERHIPFYIKRNVNDVEPKVNVDYSTTNRNDGNNVDIEKEVVDATKNSMRYNALIQAISGKFSSLKRVMRSE